MGTIHIEMVWSLQQHGIQISYEFNQIQPDDIIMSDNSKK